MPFAVMRCAKISTMGAMASSLKHNYREKETTNADPEKTPNNSHYISENTNEAMGMLRDRLPEKYRKDAVLAVEYVMTASPEWWAKATPKQQSDFVELSGQWLIEKYGKENLIAFSVHRDEKTPHIHAHVVPRTEDGRLSAKEFIGNREKMTQDQTSYAAKVQELGLERGIEGSKATHLSIQQYYARVNAATPQIPKLDVPVPTQMECRHPIEYGQKVAKDVLKQLEPTIRSLQAKAQHTDIAQRQEVAAKAATEAANANAEQIKAGSNKISERFDSLQAAYNKVIGLIGSGGEQFEHLKATLIERSTKKEAENQPLREKNLER